MDGQNQVKRSFWLYYVIPYLLLVILIANAAYLSQKYADFYIGGNFLAMADCADDCDSVMTSQYALLFGKPLPFYGLAFFVLLFVNFLCLQLSISGKFLADFRQILKKSFEGLLVLACLAAALFLYLLYFDLEMFCKYCTISHVTTYVLTIYYFLCFRG